MTNSKRKKLEADQYKRRGRNSKKRIVKKLNAKMVSSSRETKQEKPQKRLRQRLRSKPKKPQPKNDSKIYAIRLTLNAQKSNKGLTLKTQRDRSVPNRVNLKI